MPEKGNTPDFPTPPRKPRLQRLLETTTLRENLDHDPLAKLGFAPEAVEMLPFIMKERSGDVFAGKFNPNTVSTGSPLENLLRRIGRDRTTDVMGISNFDPQYNAETIVHESRHRGLEELRRRTGMEITPLQSEEDLVRLLDMIHARSAGARAEALKALNHRGVEFTSFRNEKLGEIEQMQKLADLVLRLTGKGPSKVHFASGETKEFRRQREALFENLKQRQPQE